MRSPSVDASIAMKIVGIVEWTARLPSCCRSVLIRILDNAFSCQLRISLSARLSRGWLQPSFPTKVAAAAFASATAAGASAGADGLCRSYRGCFYYCCRCLVRSCQIFLDGGGQHAEVALFSQVAEQTDKAKRDIAALKQICHSCSCMCLKGKSA